MLGYMHACMIGCCSARQRKRQWRAAWWRTCCVSSATCRSNLWICPSCCCTRLVSCDDGNGLQRGDGRGKAGSCLRPAAECNSQLAGVLQWPAAKCSHPPVGGPHTLTSATCVLSSTPPEPSPPLSNRSAYKSAAPSATFTSGGSGAMPAAAAAAASAGKQQGAVGNVSMIDSSSPTASIEAQEAREGTEGMAHSNAAPTCSRRRFRGGPKRLQAAASQALQRGANCRNVHCCFMQRLF